MLTAILLALAAAPSQAAAPPSAVIPEPKRFEFIDPATVVPAQMLPSPPARGSQAEALELEDVRKVIATASPERMAQAKRDESVEDPSIFDAVVGRRLADMPATWALLRTVQNDTGMTVSLAKKYFGRVRPWGLDPSLPHCDEGSGATPLKSYPSGHSGLGYSVGWILAQLLPEKGPAILARAQDYAQSRLICGAHFPSDVEASHVLGTLVAVHLYADPRLSSRIAAARGELAAR